MSNRNIRVSSLLRDEVDMARLVRAVIELARQLQAEASRTEVAPTPQEGDHDA